MSINEAYVERQIQKAKDKGLFITEWDELIRFIRNSMGDSIANRLTEKTFKDGNYVYLEH